MNSHSDLAVEVGGSLLIVLFLVLCAYGVVSALEWLGVPL